MKKYVKLQHAILIGSCFILSGIFLTVFPIITFDSFHYISYVDFFDGMQPFSEWNRSRGFTYPLILWLGMKSFGSSPIGLNMMLLVFYLSTIIYLYKILQLFSVKHQIMKFVQVGLLLLLIALNPIVFGYYKSILTESIAATFIIIFIYYNLKNYNSFLISGGHDLYTILQRASMFIFCVVSMYFLKEMFIILPIVIFITCEILILCKKWNKKRVICDGMIFILLFFILFSTTKIFSNMTYYFTPFNLSAQNGIVTGLRYFQVNEGISLFGSDVGIVYDKTNVIKVKDDGYNTTATFEYVYKNNLFNKVIFWAKCIREHPDRVVKGYIDNWLVLANLYYIENQNNNFCQSFVNKDFNWSVLKWEKATVSARNVMLTINVLKNGFDPQSHFQLLKLFSEKNSWLYCSDRGEQYTYYSQPNFITKIITYFVFVDFTLILYIFLICLPFFSTTYYGLMQFKYKDNIERNIYYSVNMVLSFTSFTYLLSLVMTGAVVDRYSFPAYMCMLLLSVRILSDFCTQISIKKDRD